MIEGKVWNVFHSLAIARKHKPVDIWTVIMIAALLTGVFGWCIIPLVHGVIWFCDWQEGSPINWGREVAFTIAAPFIWIFTIVEIIVVYSLN